MPGVAPSAAAAAVAAAAPADGPTHAVIAGPIAQLLESNFGILNEASCRWVACAWYGTATCCGAVAGPAHRDCSQHLQGSLPPLCFPQFRSNMADFKVHENTQLLVQVGLAGAAHFSCFGGAVGRARVAFQPTFRCAVPSASVLRSLPHTALFREPPPSPRPAVPGQHPGNHQRHGGHGWRHGPDAAAARQVGRRCGRRLRGAVGVSRALPRGPWSVGRSGGAALERPRCCVPHPAAHTDSGGFVVKTCKPCTPPLGRLATHPHPSFL